MANMTTYRAPSRTPAASRLPWPQHTVCDIRFPMHLVPQSLVQVRGAAEALSAVAERVRHVNRDRVVLTS